MLMLLLFKQISIFRWMIQVYVIILLILFLSELLTVFIRFKLISRIINVFFIFFTYLLLLSHYFLVLPSNLMVYFILIFFTFFLLFTIFIWIESTISSLPQ